MTAAIAEIYGKETGCSRGRGGSMHLIDKNVGVYGSSAIVGGTIPVGVGLGLSIKLSKQDRISCVFLGDGATEEGVFYESVNFALLKELPVLFICENNLYSVYSPLEVRQPDGRKIHEVVKGLGCKTYHEDGNDPIKILAVMESAIEHIRGGFGPVFMEFQTYRWREHCGPNYDNDIGYRTEEEFQDWKKRDPLLLMQEYMKDVEVSFFVDEEKILNEEIETAFNFAENSRYPDEESLMDYIYAE